MRDHFAVKFIFLIFLTSIVAAAQSVPPRKDIPAIAKAANGAIVSIVMSDKDGKPIAQGSGFFVSKDGVIITNYHVIAEGSSALVKLPDGAFFVVDGVLAFDKARDVAVIKAHGDNFRTLTLGNSDRVQVGQEVVAIGNPLSLESTVSNGIVSSIRTIEEEGGKYLQVTAPISPGSSGGPLFNMAGEVVGITTMYIKGGENLNFAIPINDAKRLLLAKSARLQNFPNEPESASTDAPPSTAGEGSAAQTNSPAYQSYRELLQSEDSTIYSSLYACFDDDRKSNTFMVISAGFLLDKKDLNVTTGHFTNGVFELDGLFGGHLSPFSGVMGLYATLQTIIDYKDNPSHQTDVFEWEPDVLTMKFGFGKLLPGQVRVTDEFNMQRSTGRYTDRIAVFAPGGSTIDKTGKCIRIPNIMPTPEEQYQSPK